MKTAVVVGVGRSGTSMTTGLLHQLGVKICYTPDVDKQLRQNPKGAFEDTELQFLLEISKEVQLDLDYNLIPNYEHLRNKYQSPIENYVKQHAADLWGFKCLGVYVIEVILPFLPNPHIISVTRNPLENAISYQTFCSTTIGHKPTLTQALEDVTHSCAVLMKSINRLSHYPVYLTTYEWIRSDPLGEATKMAKFLDITLSEDQKAAVITFINNKIHTWELSPEGVVPTDPRSL